MKLLNVGCGASVHPDWINLDMVALVPGVMVCDIRCGLPFETATFDAVYHSHTLEHLDPSDAERFLRECHRILKAGGILRVVVPDLEDVIGAYLEALDDCDRGLPDAHARHEWMVVELVDQMVREKGGGRMLDVIRAATPEEMPFIERRVGREILGLASSTQPHPGVTVRRHGLEHLVRCLWNVLRHPARLREALIKRLLGQEYDLLELGRYRACGEVHRWMYDRVSLMDLLRRCGFTGIKTTSQVASAIPEWQRYAFDDVAGGAPRKPHSLYMECTK